jgi:inosine/xanthosine triphosphatase
MRIGIGTQNRAKVAAVRDAFLILKQKYPEQLNNDVSFEKMDSRTSVPDMPLNQEELMNGALQRALFVYKHRNHLNFTVGLEGGVYRTKNPEAAFLQSWAYVYDGENGYFGASPALPLPATIIEALFEEHQELNVVIDTLSGKNDVRSNEGTFGILTQNLITRSKSFELAIIAATSPIFNTNFY